MSNPSENFKRIVTDPETVVSFLKVCLLFGPGFVAIGYYKQELFISLDWLKLLSLSAIFTTIFIAPLIFTSWVVANATLWKFRLRLKYWERKDHRQVKLYQDSKKRLENALLSVRGQQLDDELKRQIKSIKIKNRSFDKKLEKSNEQLLILKKELGQGHIKIQNIFLNNWVLLGILYILVIGFVGGDYFSPKVQHNFYDLLIYLTKMCYIFMPTWTVLTFLIFERKYISKYKIVQFLSVAVCIGAAILNILYYELYIIR